MHIIGPHDPTFLSVFRAENGWIVLLPKEPTEFDEGPMGRVPRHEKPDVHVFKTAREASGFVGETLQRAEEE